MYTVYSAWYEEAIEKFDKSLETVWKKVWKKYEKSLKKVWKKFEKSLKKFEKILKKKNQQQWTAIYYVTKLHTRQV